MIVYKKYNQQELDLQYNNRFHVPDFENYLQRWNKLSHDAVKKHDVVKDVPYGDKPRERLDIFPSPNPLAPTLVFIHGGYWQMFDKSDFHFIAAAFPADEITTVIINYPLIPVVNMDQLVMSSRMAVDWISNNIAKWNGDPGKIYITGHSAGAHLSAMIAAKEKGQSDQSFIKGVCTMSGLFDLVPIQLANLNDVLQMNKEAAVRNSPVLKDPYESGQLLIAVGAGETDEFKDQSRQLYNSWKSKISSVEHLEIPGLNHFSILDSFCDEHSILHQSMCKLMEL